MIPDPATLTTRAQQCLLELGWTAWTGADLLGWGNSCVALRVSGREGQEAVLLVEHDRMLFPLPVGVADGYSHMKSGVNIRHVLQQAGWTVPHTLSEPQRWSGGCAILISLVPGRDIQQWLGQQRKFNAGQVAKSVAQLVHDSHMMGAAHPAHATGWGKHLFGQSPPFSTCLEAFHAWVAPLRGLRHDAGLRLGHLEWQAMLWLRNVERKTLIWDVGDRNVMLTGDDQDTRVHGLVDLVDLWSGDPMFVPGASLAMFSDVGGGDGGAYEAGWKEAWEGHAGHWRRTQLWRVATLARYVGRLWRKQGHAPEGLLGQWNDACDALLDRARE